MIVPYAMPSKMRGMLEVFSEGIVTSPCKVRIGGKIRKIRTRNFRGFIASTSLFSPSLAVKPMLKMVRKRMDSHTGSGRTKDKRFTQRSQRVLERGFRS